MDLGDRLRPALTAFIGVAARGNTPSTFTPGRQEEARERDGGGSWNVAQAYGPIGAKDRSQSCRGLGCGFRLAQSPRVEWLDMELRTILRTGMLRTGGISAGLLLAIGGQYSTGGDRMARTFLLGRLETRAAWRTPAGETARRNVSPRNVPAPFARIIEAWPSNESRSITGSWVECRA